jgi:pyrroline-5-carboxylate reductase
MNERLQPRSRRRFLVSASASADRVIKFCIYSKVDKEIIEVAPWQDNVLVLYASVGARCTLVTPEAQVAHVAQHVLLITFRPRVQELVLHTKYTTCTYQVIITINAANTHHSFARALSRCTYH